MKDINKIWKFLQQQLTSEEQQSLENWKDISDENNDLFNEIEEVWNESEHFDDIEMLDVESNWAEIEGELVEKKRPVIRSMRWIGIAASFLLVTALVFWLYRPEEAIIEEPIYQTFTAEDKDEVLHLPDSSIVNLDKGSTLEYYTRLDESFVDRRVFLTGKATFDVTSNDTLPFVVQAATTGVKVLGTIFNVDLKDSSDISVENIEGLIKFYELLNEENAVTLEQGKKFNYNGESFVDKTPKVEIPVIKIIEKNYTIQELWYELILKFQNKLKINSYGSNDPDASIRVNLNQSLPNIIRMLEANPNVEIDYKKTCPDCYEVETLLFLN